jgi:hypothetical protein
VSPELLLPLVSSIGWLILVGAALASYRLKWSQMVKMALVWIVIFGGLFLLVEWFLMAQGTASALL